MFENNLIAGVSGQGGGYSINDSLRFNDNDSAYLSRTPATAGNRKTWTWSGWVKRGNSGAVQRLFTAGSDSNNYTILQFKATNELYLATVSSGIVYGEAQTTSQLNDPSGWYHIIFSFDADNAVGADRLKIYVNGVSQTLSITDTIENNSSYHKINQAVLHNVGARSFVNTSNTFDGYLAEINFIDGQALTADDFGQINATTGEWSPIAYSGTYGTNGFYLPFDGNANDDSGNGNNWTENNLASTDYMLDTPTNNFSVWNPLASDEVTFQEGNLEATLLTTAPRSTITTMPVSSGKWYAEVYYNANTTDALLAGVVTDSYSPVSGTIRAHDVSSGGGSVAYFLRDGGKFIDGVSSSYGSTATTGDIIGIAFNLDDDEITFYKNNVSQGTITTKAFSGGYNFFLSNGTGGGNQVATLNQGADSSFAGNKTRQGNTDANGIGDFFYEPPAGFLALCQDNLETLPFSASGGTETTITDGGVDYKVHTFTSSDTLYVQGIGEVEYLVVAGGGGGGCGVTGDVGGGGGGGAVINQQGYAGISANNYSIVVGAGGAGGPANSGDGGANGSDTSIVLSGITLVKAKGGGGGASRDDNAQNGGSGGGGAREARQTAGIAVTTNTLPSGSIVYGNAGGDGVSGVNAGGGGGASEAGNTGGTGYGGDGIEINIDGNNYYWAGGGGAFALPGGLGGGGGGGRGGTGGGSAINTGQTPSADDGGNAGANTGGGGGGGVNLGDRGGNGGSGVVIIRYAV